jgi:hypothetical protein
MSEVFDSALAKRISRKYQNSYHDLWRDKDGKLMLGCTSKRAPNVAINWEALRHFRESGGSFVGLQNPAFNTVVPLSKLDGIKPYPGENYIVVRPSNVDIVVEFVDDTPCPF